MLKELERNQIFNSKSSIDFLWSLATIRSFVFHSPLQRASCPFEAFSFLDSLQGPIGLDGPKGEPGGPGPKGDKGGVGSPGYEILSTEDAAKLGFENPFTRDEVLMLKVI